MKKYDVTNWSISLGVGTTIGALIGLGLSFTALSPLVIGGIIAAVSAAFPTFRVINNREHSKKEGFFLVLVYLPQLLQLELVLPQLQLLFFLE